MPSYNYCPNYGEDLQPVGAGKLRFQLNCAALPELSPGESRRLEMALDVPAALPAGRYDLIWALDPAVSDASVKVSVQVTST